MTSAPTSSGMCAAASARLMMLSNGIGSSSGARASERGRSLALAAKRPAVAARPEEGHPRRCSGGAIERPARRCSCTCLCPLPPPAPVVGRLSARARRPRDWGGPPIGGALSRADAKRALSTRRAKRSRVHGRLALRPMTPAEARSTPTERPTRRGRALTANGIDCGASSLSDLLLQCGHRTRTRHRRSPSGHGTAHASR
jgi:hypothetical protein